jgi:hypothetical protein
MMHNKRSAAVVCQRPEVKMQTWGHNHDTNIDFSFLNSYISDGCSILKLGGLVSVATGISGKTPDLSLKNTQKNLEWLLTY